MRVSLSADRDVRGAVRLPARDRQRRDPGRTPPSTVSSTSSTPVVKVASGYREFDEHMSSS
ncbi:hypothetical protein ACFWRZ_00670 [Streptomyces rubiginosohelvolus]|uniref:hypothetical protein n=1 Tax=Streptomyces rubiginosohelvolus TaxID=67362 RepID=UPI0036683A78